MSSRNINIKGYNFEGPYTVIDNNFNNVAGIYLISDNNGSYIDVGETDQLGTRLASHERKDCWKRNANGSINVWFHRESNSNTRLIKEKYIRNSFTFSCGKI